MFENESEINTIRLLTWMNKEGIVILMLKEKSMYTYSKTLDNSLNLRWMFV